MAQKIEEPVTIQDDGPTGDTITTHPSFCQIGASRVSGSTALYNSDFRHNAYMTISIRRSELRRGLSRDWHFGREELIEVALTEAQWATFVSAPNVGSGVPCTLQHINGRSVPGLPVPKKRSDQFGAEVLEDMAEAVSAIDNLISLIEGMGLSGVKTKAIKDGAEIAKRKLTGSIPFVASQFEEHMEEIVERSKAEVHGYMTGALIRSGVAALSKVPPLQIEDKPA